MEGSTQVVTNVQESEFWKRLEYRVCRELAGLSDKDLRELWCDGFLPETFVAASNCFVGDVWIAKGGGWQEKWRFELIAGPATGNEAASNWQDLLPSDEMTGWLSLDFEKRLLRMNPQKAYPDVSRGD